MSKSAIAVVVVTLLVACLDDRTNPVGTRITPPPPVGTAIASDPIVTGAAGVRSAAASLGASDGLVYVSLQPGTVPEGGLATVRNTRTGASVPAAMADGGFDPVAIAAHPGDTLTVQVELAGGGTQSMQLTVPAARPPVIVRTTPPPRRHDVPLNTAIQVVFSEPVSPSSITGIHVLQGGAPVSGHTSLSADGLRADFALDGLLAPNADYVLSIPTDVADLSGDHLAEPVTAAFTTGTQVAMASVATEQAALITNPFNGALRTFNMSAVRWDDGSFSGNFSIFYPGSDVRVFGRVSCFSIVGGDSAWVAGVVDGANDTSSVGQEYGWRVVDNGPPEGGVPDELTLAEPLVEDSLTAPEYCAGTPAVNQTNGSNPLNNLISGNIVVNGSGPPPPPPPAMSEIAYAAWPNGGIQAVNADGSGGRVLTADSGDFSPSWAPGGSKLAFDRSNHGKVGRDIDVISADGSGLRRLTSDGFDDSDPSWSPDGQKIVFGRGGRIYTMSASDGSGLIALTAGGFDWHPTWSPDGRRIAFGSDRTGINAIYVMNADGSGVRQLTKYPEGDYLPWWSPDGTTIAFERGRCCANSVYLINADGTGLRQLAILGRTPSWSADSRSIVFEWFGLHVVSPDGTGMVPLGPGYDPAWSPTGSMPPRPPPVGSVTVTPATDTLVVGDTVRLAATVRDPAGNVLQHRVVAWVSSDSVASDSAPLASDPPRYSVDWLFAARAPGITTIITSIDGKSDTVVIAVRPTGSGLRNLMNHPVHRILPVWRPRP